MTAAPLDLLTATFLVCKGSAVIPFLNTEIYLLGSRRWLGRGCGPWVMPSRIATPFQFPPRGFIRWEPTSWGGTGWRVSLKGCAYRYCWRQPPR